jgi:hypothetical protein
MNDMHDGGGERCLPLCVFFFFLRPGSSEEEERMEGVVKKHTTRSRAATERAPFLSFLLFFPQSAFSRHTARWRPPSPPRAGRRPGPGAGSGEWEGQRRPLCARDAHKKKRHDRPILLPLSSPQQARPLSRPLQCCPGADAGPPGPGRGAVAGPGALPSSPGGPEARVAGHRTRRGRCCCGLARGHDADADHRRHHCALCVCGWSRS